MTGPAAAAGRTPLGRTPRLLAALVCGALMTLAQPPVSAWPVIFLAIPLLVLIAGRTATAAQAGWTGWAAGTGFFATGLYWVAEAFLVDIARHGWMAPFAILFMATGLALFWALPFWLWRRIRLAGRGGLGLGLALLAGLWTLSEFARSHVLTGFPWALPSYAWSDTPVAQAGALIGPQALSFLTLLAALAPLAVIAGRRRGDRAGAALPVLALLLLGGAWAWGTARLDAPETDTGLTVRLVQPNAAQTEKWKPELAMTFFDRQRRLSAEGPRPDVVIWPETAIPWMLDEQPDVQAAISTAAQGAPVILGARHRSGPGPDADWYNALFVLGPGGTVTQRYDKHHLVPFGEYVPLGGLAGSLGLTGLVGSSFTAGTGPETLDTAGLPAFVPLICYEAIFPHEMQSDSRPAWLVQITNDAWFGSSAGPYQHFAQARMRAIEQGLPLARAANTGISAMIDPYGRVRAALPLLEAGAIDAALPEPLPETPYARSGDGPAMGFVLLLCLLAGFTRPARRN